MKKDAHCVCAGCAALQVVGCGLVTAEDGVQTGRTSGGSLVEPGYERVGLSGGGRVGADHRGGSSIM